MHKKKIAVVSSAPFWEKVDVRGVDDCWLWNGAVTNGRYKYGYCTVQKKNMLAHRYSYTLHYGAIPIGMKVLHQCDIPLCVNPKHLFLGTQKDNMQDCVRKGRHGYGVTIGERHHATVLTENDVRRIRFLRSSGVTLQKIADEYGITHGSVSFIVSRQTWAHVKDNAV